jgi:integrase
MMKITITPTITDMTNPIVTGVHQMNITRRKIMGKRPLSKEQIQQLRRIVKGNPLHELLLNLGIDLMLRSSDLRSLKVSDVLNPSGTVKESVSVKQIKTGKRTLAMPIMDNSRTAIAEHLSSRSHDDFVFSGNKSNYTKQPISTQQYARIVKGWMVQLGLEDVSEFSTHSMRKSKASLIYEQTHDVDAVRRLLGQSSVTATSAYLGVTDNSALELAKSFNI